MGPAVRLPRILVDDEGLVMVDMPDFPGVRWMLWCPNMYPSFNTERRDSLMCCQILDLESQSRGPFVEILLKEPLYRALGLRKDRNLPNRCFHFTEHEA